MKNLEISSTLAEKIYDSKYEHDSLSIVTTYFPLEEIEKQEILKAVGKEENTIDFKSIFSDKISEEEWTKTKSQIKKKFHDELLSLD